MSENTVMLIFEKLGDSLYDILKMRRFKGIER
jgi:hypothetical protein